MTPDRYCDLRINDLWREHKIGRIDRAEFDRLAREARIERDRERRLDDLEDEL